jgi:hypothetical protein
MENTQPTNKVNVPEPNTSGVSTKSSERASMPLGGSRSSSKIITAAMPKGSRKTWASAELAELRLKAGLVAGALADFQTAGGLVVAKNIEVRIPSGVVRAVKFYLVAEGIELRSLLTGDGIDLVAEKVDTQ